METEAVATKESGKRRLSEHVSEGEEDHKPKKAKLYSIKQFRKQLQSGEKLQALKEFSNLLSSNPKHDFVLDYLKDGGNCLELLQTLEADSQVPPSVVFDSITHILLGITARHGQYRNSAYESCRYLINNFLPVIHKMLGLSSSKEERKVCLRLLTAMSAFSSNLARDLLLNVKFHSANIELLTKHTGEKNSVRDHFVQFLTAFLVESEWHTLSVLLDKSWLLTSIISGLQYDNADTVCIVVAAMKNHILENPSVTKTLKMYVFNTAVVKDIVNLYNWKGLEGLKTLDKASKGVAIEVDKVAKSKVSECVHDFLLVLCTSNKFGLIFRDPTVGLGKKNSNGLMYTVLDSLDRPWEHSYASDLVLKICKSCPDLTKNMWLILKPYLEPRLTEKWLNAMIFARQLIEAMEPECIEFCIKDLSPQQLAQVTEILVSPFPVLKTLVNLPPEEENKVAFHIVTLLSCMLKQVNEFLTKIQIWTNPDTHLKVSHILSTFIAKHYPSAETLLEGWSKLPYPLEEKQPHLETILDVLALYKSTAPQLLSNLTTSFDFRSFLFDLPDFEEVENIQIKLVDIFADVDQTSFLPKSETFPLIVPLLLRRLHRTKDPNTQNVLRKLLKNTGVFDGNPQEIDIWLNGIFNLPSLKTDFLNVFVEIFKKATANLPDLQKELLHPLPQTDVAVGHSDLIEQLLSLSENLEDGPGKPKRKVLSPAIVALLKCCSENPATCKAAKKYGEFVLWNLFHEFPEFGPGFQSLFQEYSSAVPSSVTEYVDQWVRGVTGPLPKIKGALVAFKDIGEQFLTGCFTEPLETAYPGFWVDVLRMCNFYFSNSMAEGQLKNLIFLVRQSDPELLSDYVLELIFDNPVLVKLFGVVSKKVRNSLATRAVFEFSRVVLDKGVSLEAFSRQYASRIFEDLKKLLKNPRKYSVREDFDSLLEAFPLTYRHCSTLLSLITECPAAKEDQTLLKLLGWCLQRLVNLYRQNPKLEPLSGDILQSLSAFMVDLNPGVQGDLSRPLRHYLKLFPHATSQIDSRLFLSLLTATEYNKDNADLVLSLLKTDPLLTRHLEDNLPKVCETKGLVLPLLDCLVSDTLLKGIYDHLESSITKAIHKPQKVGQHFQKNYSVASLITKFMPVEKCSIFLDKVHKFEVSEEFHAKLLAACCSKALQRQDRPTKKQLGNVVTTFVHLLLGVLKKTPFDHHKAKSIAEIFRTLLTEIHPEDPLDIVNDPFKTLCKFSLKYGLDGTHDLLVLLRNLLKVVKIQEEDAQVVLDMLLSHSEFLNVILGENSDRKLAVLQLFLLLCQEWNFLMDKSHMAVLLASYQGMVTRCDRTILVLLKLYESKPEQTKFYDFKPFLCGRAAAIHYSVRNQIASSLNRQPKVADVLGILKEDKVKHTITNYPLKDDLQSGDYDDTQDLNCYDLKFFLPLFSHVLAPEQQVKTYVFIRSGALSLTVLGLACQDKELRQAACHVLARLHFHLEARQTGKDNLLWIRYVEALCKGVALLPNFKLNTFSAVFFARTASILTNPKHVMFAPLSLYLTSKPDLDLGTVPELYTLLFSPDVNFKEHRAFILEVLRDGMRTDKDFLDFLKSMAYKLFSELFSSCLADPESRLLILDVVAAICRIPLGVRMLVENNSLLPQLEFVVEELCGVAGDSTTLGKVLEILGDVVKVAEGQHVSRVVFDICQRVVTDGEVTKLKEPQARKFYELLCGVCGRVAVEDKRGFVDRLAADADDQFCNYLRKFGCEFISEKREELQDESHKFHFLRRLCFQLLK